ncbi:MAG: tripartite tricarboxylate transporter substrate-binding protein, partial [Achromobacter xylosoxidans]|nr:tripartite tricarboxylate transporter substrate-binding protein [Achromobacter xylosoxidans]
ATGMPQAEAGKVKVFAITSPNRLATESKLPTLAEQGYAGFDMTAWFSFVAPKGTPAPVLEKLQAALADTLRDEAVKKRMLEMGIDPRSGSPSELAQQIKNEQPIVSQLIKQANIVLQ